MPILLLILEAKEWGEGGGEMATMCRFCIQEKILGLPNPDSADFFMPTVLLRTIGFQR
jgi:hypothetical protein